MFHSLTAFVVRHHRHKGAGRWIAGDEGQVPGFVAQPNQIQHQNWLIARLVFVSASNRSHSGSTWWLMTALPLSKSKRHTDHQLLAKARMASVEWLFFFGSGFGKETQIEQIFVPSGRCLVAA